MKYKVGAYLVTKFSFTTYLLHHLDLIHFVSHKQSWASTLKEVAQDCAVLSLPTFALQEPGLQHAQQEARPS